MVRGIDEIIDDRLLFNSRTKRNAAQKNMTAEEINNNQIPQDASKMTHKHAQKLILMAREAGIDLGDARRTRELRERWAAAQGKNEPELQKSDYIDAGSM